MMLVMQPIWSLRFIMMLANQPAMPPNTIQLMIPMTEFSFAHLDYKFLR
jgi:hypothetical protein